MIIYVSDYREGGKVNILKNVLRNFNFVKIFINILIKICLVLKDVRK